MVRFTLNTLCEWDSVLVEHITCATAVLAVVNTARQKCLFLQCSLRGEIRHFNYSELEKHLWPVSIYIKSSSFFQLVSPEGWLISLASSEDVF